MAVVEPSQMEGHQKTTSLTTNGMGGRTMKKSTSKADETNIYDAIIRLGFYALIAFTFYLFYLSMMATK